MAVGQLCSGCRPDRNDTLIVCRVAGLATGVSGQPQVAYSSDLFRLLHLSPERRGEEGKNSGDDSTEPAHAIPRLLGWVGEVARLYARAPEGSSRGYLAMATLGIEVEAEAATPAPVAYELTALTCRLATLTWPAWPR